MSFHHSPKIVTDGLVLCLDAADKNSYPGSGTTWTDLSGNGNATMVNSPVFSSTHPSSFSFDANTEYFSLTNNNEMSMTGNVTLISWFKQPTTGYPHQTTLCTFNHNQATSRRIKHIQVKSMNNTQIQ